jgi:hypothetical protein
MYLNSKNLFEVTFDESKYLENAIKASKAQQYEEFRKIREERNLKE